MFDIGWGELVVIGIVALIAIGPKELPTVLRTLGQYMGKVRRMASEFQGQFQEAMREAELAELKKQAEDLKNSVSDLGNSVSDLGNLDPLDPLADTKKQIESAFDDATTPELPKPQTPSAAESEPTPPSTADVALPEPAAPVSEKDFAAAEEPPPKQAGGKA
jgi:sec-independent protein translocase protein TatB